MKELKNQETSYNILFQRVLYALLTHLQYRRLSLSKAVFLSRFSCYCGGHLGVTFQSSVSSHTLHSQPLSSILYYVCTSSVPRYHPPSQPQCLITRQETRSEEHRGIANTILKLETTLLVICFPVQLSVLINLRKTTHQMFYLSDG